MRISTYTHVMVQLTLFIGGICHTAQAKEREMMRNELGKMKADPLAYQLSIPAKYNANGTVVTFDALPFPQSMIDDGSFITEKDLLRRDALLPAKIDLTNVNVPTFAPINTENDDPNRFLSAEHRGDDLVKMQSDNLTSGNAAAQPWSGDYWATYKGGTAARYEDPKFPHDDDWKKNYDYVQSKPVLDVVNTGNVDLVAQLSPSEKYELIVGDHLQLLTKAQWQGGKSFRTLWFGRALVRYLSRLGAGCLHARTSLACN